MHALILALMIGDLAVPPATERTTIEPQKVARQAMPAEPERAPVQPGCTICLLTFIHNPLSPAGQEMIREECGYQAVAVSAIRDRQLQIANEGNISWRHWEDWGTWYGPHRIESVVPALQPPCY
jgi:hypothetical protein